MAWRCVLAEEPTIWLGFLKTGLSTRRKRMNFEAADKNIPDSKFHLEIWNPEFVICNSVMASGASPCNFKVESH